MSVVAFIRNMQELGFELDDAVRAAEAFEAALAQKGVDAQAERRRAKDRDRKRIKKHGIPRNSAESAESAESERVSLPPTPPNPSGLEPTPFTPLKGGVSPSLFDAGWKAFPETGRRRSSTKKSRPQWDRASKAAGGEPTLLRCVELFSESEEALKDGGKFVQAFDRWLRDRMWEHWLDPPDAAPVVEMDPWPRRLREWERNRYWPDEWGPKPGRPGYLGPALETQAA